MYIYLWNLEPFSPGGRASHYLHIYTCTSYLVDSIIVCSFQNLYVGTYIETQYKYEVPRTSYYVLCTTTEYYVDVYYILLVCTYVHSTSYLVHSTYVPMYLYICT